MIYMRRIDLPKEVLNVADENLRGNTDFCASWHEPLTLPTRRILGRDGEEVSSSSERKGTLPDQADGDHQRHSGEQIESLIL